MKVSISWRCFFGFSLVLVFDLILQIPLSMFSWLSRWNLWLCRIFSTFSDILLSRSVGLLFYSFESFQHQRLSDSKSPQVSRTLLSILTNLNSTEVWIVFTRLLIIIIIIIHLLGGSPHGVVANIMDCGIVVSEFKLQSRYNVRFRTKNLGTDMDLLISPAMD